MRDGRPPFGILFQSGALWTSMSVLENVTLPMDLQGYSTPAARAALARFKLALVGPRRRRGPLPGEPERRDAQARRARAGARARSERAVSRRALRRIGSLDFAAARRARSRVARRARYHGRSGHARAGRASTASPTACCSSTARRIARWRWEVPPSWRDPRTAARCAISWRDPGRVHSAHGGRKMTKPGATLIGVFVLGAIALIVAGVLFFGSGAVRGEAHPDGELLPRLGRRIARRRAGDVSRRARRRSEIAWAIRIDPDTGESHHSGQHGAVARNGNGLRRRHRRRDEEADP